MINPPTTLKEFADNEVEAYTSAKAAAQKTLTAAQQEVANAQAQAAKDSAALDKTNQAVSAARATLASATLPADATKAADDLEQALAALHGAQGAVLADEQRSDESRRAGAAAQADLERADSSFATAQSAQAQSKKDDDAKKQWAAATGAAPLAQLATAASTYLTSKPYTDADKRLDDDFPKELRDRAEDRLERALKRRKREQALSTTVQTKLDAELVADTGVAGQVAKDRTSYEVALAELRELALLGQERLARAQALVAGVNSAPPLTTAEKKRITRTDIVDAGKKGVTDEGARDDARDKVADKELEIEQARVAVVATTPDAANPDADATVAPLVAALPALKTALGTAQGTLAGTQPGLDTWEATVPDSSWRLLADFSEATFILTALAGTNPYTTTTKIADLATNLAAADKTLAGDLQKQAERTRAVWYLERRASAEGDRLAEAARLETPAAFSALRGDQS